MRNVAISLIGIIISMIIIHIGFERDHDQKIDEISERIFEVYGEGDRGHIMNEFILNGDMCDQEGNPLHPSDFWKWVEEGENFNRRNMSPITN